MTQLRSVALPAEHGGWSMVLQPLILALLVAPSKAGALLATAAALTFLARHPLKLLVQDLRRGRWFQRTRLCAWIAPAYAGTAAVALVAALTASGKQTLLPLAAGAVLALIQFACDIRQRGRSFAAEMCGGCAAAMTAPAIALAAHRRWEISVALLLIALSLTLPAVLFVRSVLRRELRRTTMLMHVVAVAAAGTLWHFGLTPAVAVAVMAMLLLRAMIGLQTKTRPAARVVGMREAVWGAAAVIIIAAGYLA